MATQTRVICIGLGVLLATACRGGQREASPTPVVSSAPASASSAPARPAITGAAAGPSLPEVRPLLDDPRLAKARERDRAKDPAGAARELAEARRAGGFDARDACLLAFVEGTRQAAAGATAEALLAFDVAEKDECLLAPHAKLRAAQAVARAGRADEAIERAKKADDPVVADEAALVAAEAEWFKGNKAEAAKKLRAWLGKNGHGPRWVDASVKVATAALEGGDARDALELTTRVVVEAPRYADSSGATALRARACAALKKSDALGPEERARRAQTWLDAGDPAKAYADAASVTAELKPPSAPLCKAAIVRANASPKGAKAPPTDPWAEAITACAGQDELVTALYSGAKAAGSKKRDEALARFAMVEQKFPKHRYADDARFRAALLLKDAGDEDKAITMLRALPDDYPDGDMKGEALFRVAMASMLAGKTAEARAALAKVDDGPPDDRQWATAGRSAYFLAKLDEQAGDKEKARAQYQAIVRQKPLFFYMAMAYSRLAEMDEALAKRALDEAVAAERERAPEGRLPDAASSVHFARAVELLRAQEVEPARRELSASGALDPSGDPLARAVAAALLDRAGAPDQGAGLLRGRAALFWGHYPVGAWRLHWEAAYPRAFEPHVVQEAGKNAIPASLVWAIMREESAFLPEARSPSNAFGLMQLILPTAKWIAQGTTLPSDEASLKKPEVSVALGARLLSRLRQTHPAHPGLAIAAYNGGSGAVNRWIGSRRQDDFDLFVELIPWDETRNYVKRVMMSEAVYTFLYDSSVLHATLTTPRRVAP